MEYDPEVRDDQKQTAEFTPRPVGRPDPKKRRRDRRSRPTSPWSSFKSPRRRTRSRRAEEVENTYVDRFTAHDVALLVSILVLNLLDAVFTLLWIQRGGAEANPFMAFMLELGDGFFLAQKCFMVGLWLIFLTIHKNFRLARIGLYSLAAVYLLLLAGHITLLTHDVDPNQALTIQLGSSDHPAQQRGYGRLDP
ncbi:MAG: DUF5658 family protein [Myxococcota bacterium]